MLQIRDLRKSFGALRADVPLAQTPWPKFHGNPRNTGNVLDNLPP
jgi:hypothetical protein